MPGGLAPWYLRCGLDKSVAEVPGGWSAHGIFIPWSDVHSPEGECWPTYELARLRTLLDEYGHLCNMAGAIFPIASGYRSDRYQDKFHRSGARVHCRGMALDLLPAGGLSVRQMAAWAVIRRRVEGSMLCGIGITDKWLHIDIKPRQHGTTWVHHGDRAD
jgi:hypothetical protein